MMHHFGFPMLRRLRRCRRGSAAAEMALVAPILAALLFGAFDVANGVAMKLALEEAAERTAELATAPGTVLTTYASFRNEVIAAYGSPYRTASVDNWLECNGTRNAAFNGTCPAGQQIARYMAIRIDAEYVPYFNLGGVFEGNGPNGGYITAGDAVVRIQ